jgi:hypothetical protein
MVMLRRAALSAQAKTKTARIATATSRLPIAGTVRRVKTAGVAVVDT